MRVKRFYVYALKTLNDVVAYVGKGDGLRKYLSDETIAQLRVVAQ